MFLALMDSGGKTSARFPTRSLVFSYGLIFDPFIPLGIITLQCWSYLGLPNTNVVCVKECFLNVFNTIQSGMVLSMKVNTVFI